jgi:hypothetical protein
MDHDGKRVQVEAARQNYLAKMCVLTSSSKHSINFNQVLQECQILLSLHEMGLEVWEVKLVAEQARGLHSFDGRDVSMELQELHTRMAGVEDEHTAETRNYRCWW